MPEWDNTSLFHCSPPSRRLGFVNGELYSIIIIYSQTILLPPLLLLHANHHSPPPNQRPDLKKKPHGKREKITQIAPKFKRALRFVTNEKTHEKREK